MLISVFHATLHGVLVCFFGSHKFESNEKPYTLIICIETEKTNNHIIFGSCSSVG